MVPQTNPKPPDVLAALFAGAATGVVLLISQNLLGMYMNFWVDLAGFPSVVDAFKSEAVLDAHVAVGSVIVLLITLGVVRVFRSENRFLRLPAVSALTFSLVAFLSGVEFTFGGGDDQFSFTMELGFVGMFGSAATLLYLIGRHQKKPAEERGHDNQGNMKEQEDV